MRGRPRFSTIVSPANIHAGIQQRRPFALILGLLLCICCGCATWNHSDGDNNQVTTIRNTDTLHHHPESIVLRSQFIPVMLPDESEDMGGSVVDPWETLWRSVDETAIENGVRRRLIDNGLRVGRVNNRQRLEAELTALRPSHDVVEQFMQQADVDGDVAGLDGSEPMRIGKRYELPVRRSLVGQHVILARLNGETVGQTLFAPQPLLAIRPETGSLHGQVRLQVRPEIQHGAMQKSFTTSRAAVRVEQRRQAWALDDLRWTVELSEGDTFLIAPTREQRGVGGSMMFHQDEGGEVLRTMLLLSIDHLPSIEDGL